MRESEAAEFLGVTPRTVRNYRNKGWLPFRQIPGKTCPVIDYEPADLAALKAQLKTQSEPKAQLHKEPALLGREQRPSNIDTVFRPKEEQPPYSGMLAPQSFSARQSASERNADTGLRIGTIFKKGPTSVPPVNKVNASNKATANEAGGNSKETPMKETLMKERPMNGTRKDEPAPLPRVSFVLPTEEYESLCTEAAEFDLKPGEYARRLMRGALESRLQADIEDLRTQDAALNAEVKRLRRDVAAAVEVILEFVDLSPTEAKEWVTKNLR